MAASMASAAAYHCKTHTHRRAHT